MFPLRYALTLAVVACTAMADPADTVSSTNVSPDAATALARLRVASGLKLSLWAGEPLVQNITSLSYDHLGRAYVVETGRRRTSVFDVRNLGPWLEDDFSLRSTGDRAGFLHRVLTPTNAAYPAFLEAVNKGGKGGFLDFNRDGVIDWRDLEVEAERIRLVSDGNGDGVADKAVTFAEGFNGPISGVAAGVLAEGTNVWFTCIPDLWKLPAAGQGDAGGEPISPRRDPTLNPLLSGFGVHIAFGGHDLHGLIKGPDGRIYFSVADRGANVTNREGQAIALTDCGAVFRCEPDGSRFEAFATGLRNPQELAFDNYGNLWTGDNNGDGGDKARWTLVLEGANYGWTMGWQWLPKMGAWNSERLWHTRESNSAAYIMPPVAHLGHGPAGICYYPGTGLGERFQEHFFYADFPGGVRHFRVEPEGAFFKIAQAEGAGDSWKWMEDNSVTNFTGKLLWDLSPVDVTFPPFGGVIVADWVQGWEKTGKGRLWHVTDPAANAGQITEVSRLLAAGMTGRNEKELIGLLGHRDQRVRLEAQWEWVRRHTVNIAARSPGPGGTVSVRTAGDSMVPRLVKLLRGKESQLTRIHALWALAQIARRDPTQNLTELLPVLDDPDPVVRLQAVNAVGSRKLLNAYPRLTNLAVNDPSLAVRAASVRELGRLQDFSAPAPIFKAGLGATVSVLLGKPPESSPPSFDIAPILAAVRGDESHDPVLFHSTVEALTKVLRGAQQGRAVLAATRDGSERVRLAVLEAMRRHEWIAVTNFLHDSSPLLVLEAARAVHDVPLTDGLPMLAALVSARTPLLSGAAATWPTNANFSQAEWRSWVLRRAVNAAFRLGDDKHAVAVADFAAQADNPESVRIEALEALASWGTPPKRDRVVGLYRPLPGRNPEGAKRALSAVWTRLTAGDTPGRVVVAALQAGVALGTPRLDETMVALSQHRDTAVQTELARVRDATGKPTVEDLLARLDKGSIPSQQAAFRKLGENLDERAVAALGEWVQKLISNQVPAEVSLDVLDAARGAAKVLGSSRQGATLNGLLTRWTNSLPKDDSLARYRVALSGGDAANGRKLFAERADWGCQRCHKLRSEGGDVGPELFRLGQAKGREHVLRSIVSPNAEIAPGYETVLIERKDDTTITGVLREDKTNSLVLISAEDGRVEIQKDDIKSRASALSPMPEGLTELMTLRELRDLVEMMMQ